MVSTICELTDALTMLIKALDQVVDGTDANVSAAA